MGNLPMSKRTEFGEYSEISKGQFSATSFRPYDMSVEDLRPMLARSSGNWIDGSVCDSATILGLEMDQESEDVYSGVLKFHFSDGLECFSENLQVQTSTTVSDLLPELITQFLPHQYQLDAVDGTHPSSIALVQGQRERVLDSDEKPLEIALDCSAKGLASPKFHFKSALPPNAPPHTRARRASRAGLTEDYAFELCRPDHYNSMSSIASGLSLASSKSSKSKSSTSLTSGKKKVRQTLSNQEMGVSPSSSPSHRLTTPTHQNTPTPNGGRKLSRSKAAVSNFISRSLRGRRKSKPSAPPSGAVTDAPEDSPATFSPQDRDSNEEEEENEEELDRHLTNSLISPRFPIEKKFTLSTVMHIYFTEGKQAQVYKSVLVSQKATTVEVIAQALERYNMKSKDPSDYTLFDVIGKWQDVTNTSTCQTLGLHNRTAPSLSSFNILNASPLIQRRTSVEEFVVCYCRELGANESPYNTQFYLTNQEGFTRRFELQSKHSPSPMNRGGISHEKSHSVDIMERPDEVTPTPDDTGETRKGTDRHDEFIMFGNTAHRKRARRNRIGNQSVDSADPDTQVTILNNSVPPIAISRGVADDVPSQHHPGGSSPSSSSRGRETTHHLATSNVGVVRENGLRQDDSEIPISLNATHMPDFVTLVMCSSPDSGVEFHKQPNSTKSSVSSEQSGGGGNDDASIAAYPANLACPFLLSLRLQEPGKEHLVHRLTSDVTELGNWTVTSTPSSSSSPWPREDQPGNPSAAERVSLHFPGLEGLLCCFSRQLVAAAESASPSPDSAKFAHTLRKTNPDVCVSVNGDDIAAHSAVLRHGDVIEIGDTAGIMLMFVDYTARPGGDPLPHYNWKPLRGENSQGRPPGKMSVSMETIKERDLSRAETSACEGEGDSALSPEQGGMRGEQPRHASKSSKGVGSSANSSRVHVSNGSGSSSSGRGRGNKEGVSRSPQHRKLKSHHQNADKTRSLPLPKDRKLMFSFRSSEEDVLLSHVVSARASSDSQCKLAPAYILAMCTEYSVMACGPKHVQRFIRKATDRIQEVVWEFTKKLASLEQDSQMPLNLKKDLFPLLEPVFLWLANGLEFYNFLITHRTALHLPTRDAAGANQTPGEKEGEEGSDNPIATLYSVLVYAYQQAFYPVSKVLYQSLPLMLESCVEENLYDRKGATPIVIGEAVAFLQALLDLITDQHLHLEVVSQFYANIFFFINAAMFNALLEQGGDLGLYQEYSGTILRENLNLLEGWACQVGFKDSVLHYLAKFSGAIDLLATPSDKLLNLNWSYLRDEFPVLHPAQLHYLLSQYLLPSSTDVPRHWTPSKEDARSALTENSLEESFDDHPGFRLPSSSFSLDLNRPPPEPEVFQEILDELRSTLSQLDRESGSSSTPSPPAHATPIKVAVFDANTASSAPGGGVTGGVAVRNVDERVTQNGYSERSEVSSTESEEDLLAVSAAHRNHKNLENGFNHSQSQSSDHGSPRNIIMDSFRYRNGNGTAELPSTSEKVGRVRSVVSVRSFSTPEKLVLTPTPPGSAEVGGVCGSETPPTGGWMGKFPRGSLTATVPRGDKGFGFIMVEKKDPTSKEPLIVVQQILPGSPAASCNLLRPGDQILAIDEQLLDGADYLIADKYVKAAEDDVTLILAPRLPDL